MKGKLSIKQKKKKKKIERRIYLIKKQMKAILLM